MTFLAVLTGYTAPLAAQDTSAEPTFATVELEAGFVPDPHAVSVVAGGEDTAIGIGGHCTGFINAAAPDVALSYTAAEDDLFIGVSAEIDTTLVVRAPDDAWHCNDDATGLDPVVAFSPAQTGRYQIWVGTVEAETASAILLIRESDPRDASASQESEESEEQELGYGSGFFVTADGHILTSAHVIADCTVITVAEHGPAEVVASDEEADLALLQVASAGDVYATFRADPPPLGTDVVLVGYPLVDVLGTVNVTTGVVSGLIGIGGDSRHFQFSAPLQQGNSGGPLLDEHGLVVGVARGKLDEVVEIGRSGSLPQNINFAVRNTAAMAFLEANGVVARRSQGGVFWSRPEVAAQGAAVTVPISCES